MPSEMMPTDVKRVAIIGGGYTGAAVAYHLVETGVDCAITVYEPRSKLGLGLAYGATDPSHRINVPAAKMSLVPAQESHFVDWIAKTQACDDDPAALAADGQLYVRRSVFGRYVSEHVERRIRSGHIVHVKDKAAAVSERPGEGWNIRRQDGTVDTADIIVFATTHPPPSLPLQTLASLAGDERVIFDATQPGVLERIDRDSRVLIVGSGLTMADVVATLDRQHHRGAILAISRHGLQSRGHASTVYPVFGDFVTAKAATAVQLLRNIRRTIDEASKAGIPWQPVIDAVRAQASLFWPSLPLIEKRRVVRHLRAFWDVHRFRIAPQPEGVIQRRRSEGTFELLAASLAGAKATAKGLHVALRPRGAHQLRHETVDYLILTTGPDHASIIEGQPYLRSLRQQGWIKADPLHLGILCNRRGQAIGADGKPNATLLVAGPLGRFEFGELMGLPQVTNQAIAIAGEVASEISSSRFRGADLQERAIGRYRNAV